MESNIAVEEFLSHYSADVAENATTLRALILENLNDVQESIDLPAKMIAYVFGRRYDDMICTIIPSKKGLNLGFYKGVELPDPGKILRGDGKLSRYVEIKSKEDVDVKQIRKLIDEAYKAYKKRTGR